MMGRLILIGLAVMLSFWFVYLWATGDRAHHGEIYGIILCGFFSIGISAGFPSREHHFEADAARKTDFRRIPRLNVLSSYEEKH